MSFLSSNFYSDFFFKKEEPPPPPPSKPPNLFGGLSVKTPPVLIQNNDSFVPKPLEKEKTLEIPVKQSNQKDPFEDISPAPYPKFEKNPSVDKKNDVNSIEFLLDLTLPTDGPGSKSIFKQPAEKKTETKPPKEPKKNKETDKWNDPKPRKLSENHNQTNPESVETGYLIKETEPKNIEKDSFIEKKTEEAKQNLQKENKFKQKIDEKKKKEQETKSKQEIAKMQEKLEEQKKFLILWL